MSKFTKITSAVLGTAAIIGCGMASASPILQIVADAALNPPDFVHHSETIGDAGGSVYPWAGGPGPGAGVPSDIAGSGAGGVGWPNNGPGGYPPGFALDSSFPPSGGGAYGTSGWHASYLYLSEAANVTFQFMGAGDSTSINHFFVDQNGNGSRDPSEYGFLDGQTSGPTNPCPVSGTAPSCDILSGGYPVQNQFTLWLNAGLIPFVYLTGGGVSLINSGPNMYNPPTENGPAGYFLGVDPYLATGQYDTSGRAVYAGLTDAPTPGDHDFQDMGVRISVPEPGSIFLLGAGLIGMGVGRRRLTRSV